MHNQRLALWIKLHQENLQANGVALRRPAPPRAARGAGVVRDAWRTGGAGSAEWRSAGGRS